MMQHRWAIPASLGAVSIVLAGVSFATSKDHPVKEAVQDYAIGEAHTFSNIPLEAGKKYRLVLAPTSGVAVNQTQVVSAALSRDDAPVFEVEDAYWHERGVWREGGESGTWDEQNSFTMFAFEVPESGNYELEISLPESSTRGARIGMRILWLDHFPLTAWPLFLGGVLLFGVAAVAQMGGRTAMGKFIEDLGVGSRLSIDGTEYTVIERTECFEDHLRIGVELRIRDANGISRYLAVDRYERVHPWNEETDQLVTEILLEIRMHPQQLEKLADVDANETLVAVGDEVFTLDRENSGRGVIGAVRNGETYRSDFMGQAYRGGRMFPINPGDRWLERTWWVGTNDVEWSLMEVVDWTKIEILEVKEPIKVDVDALYRQRSTDPLGVRQTPGLENFGSIGVAQSAPTTAQTHDIPQEQSISVDWKPPSDNT